MSALAAWVVCTAWWLWDGWRRRRVLAQGALETVLACAGLAIALCLAGELELLRRAEHRPALTWIHDWRWSLNHAQAIARSGDVSRALDYAGAGLDYHVGPAWLAAAVQRTLGGGIADVLFGVVPVLCLLGIVLGGRRLLRAAGAGPGTALLAVAVALALPLSDRSVLSLDGLRAALTSPISWPFLPTDMMLNSMLGFAVGMAALAMLRSTTEGGVLAVVTVGLASLLPIKPQYYVGFGSLAGSIAVSDALRARGWANRRPLVAVVASLPLAFAALKLLPGDPPYLAAPVWASASDRGPFVEAIRVTSAAGAIAFLVWLTASVGARRSTTALRDWLVAAGAVVALLGGVLYLLDFPYRGEVVRRLVALGVDARSSAIQGDDALSQALEGPRFVLLAVAVSLLALRLRAWGRAGRIALLLAAGAIVVSPLELAVATAGHPPAELAVAEDADLFRLLQQIPREATLLAASDLADPANSNKRALRAPLLTAYDGHAFYVADLRYVHYARPDALDRLDALRHVFGTRWTSAQEAWLTRTGVTHLLVDDRCPAAWEGQANAPLERVARVGHWRAYRWTGARSPSTAEDAPPSVQARYGRSACLGGETVRLATPPPAPAQDGGRSGTNP